jgi:endonuclease YncB( thermonuclease family)
LSGIDAPEKGRPSADLRGVHGAASVRARCHRSRQWSRSLRAPLAEVLLPDGRSLNQEPGPRRLRLVVPLYSRDAALAELEAQVSLARVGSWASASGKPWAWRKSQPRAEAVPAGGPSGV